MTEMCLSGQHVGNMSADMLATCPQNMSKRVLKLSNQNVVLVVCLLNVGIYTHRNWN